MLATENFSVLALDSYRDSEATREWPSPSDMIRSSTVEEDVSTDRITDGPRRTCRTNAPVVRHEYAVEGTTYQGYHVRAAAHGAA